MDANVIEQQVAERNGLMAQLRAVDEQIQEREAGLNDLASTAHGLAVQIHRIDQQIHQSLGFATMRPEEQQG